MPECARKVRQGLKTSSDVRCKAQFPALRKATQRSAVHLRKTARSCCIKTPLSIADLAVSIALFALPCLWCCSVDTDYIENTIMLKIAENY